MKKITRIIILVAAIIALVLLFTAVEAKYQAYRHQQAVTRQQTASKQASDFQTQLQAQLSAQQKAFDTKYAALKAQCVNGQTAYSLLPVVSQRRVTAPNCEL